jgi:hypothetical protein
MCDLTLKTFISVLNKKSDYGAYSVRRYYREQDVLPNKNNCIILKQLHRSEVAQVHRWRLFPMVFDLRILLQKLYILFDDRQ